MEMEPIGEQTMVVVRLWPAQSGNPSYIGPHGIVHVGCGRMPQRLNNDWHEAADEHAADIEFPDRLLFWCTAERCFGHDNARRFPRNVYGPVRQKGFLKRAKTDTANSASDQSLWRTT